VVRCLVGYRRLKGQAAVETLTQLYAFARLFVNFFQPSFKLKEKVRRGGRVVKHYDAPQTPCARLLSSNDISEQVKARLHDMAETLDPLLLLDPIRDRQRQLALLAAGGQPSVPTPPKDDLTRFLAGLSSAWHEGEVRPTHQAKPSACRYGPTRKDPFETVWPTICQWLDKEPDRTGRDLFMRLQRDYPGIFPDGQLRTLQRRIRAWRRQMVHPLVFGEPTSGNAAPRYRT
jgi:hypothetical protein